MLILTLLAAACLGQADPVEEKLEKQRIEYEGVRDEVVNDLLKKAADKENAARKSKRPGGARIAALVADQENLKIRGLLPGWADKRTQAKLVKARNAMKKALSQARLDYTRERRDAAAERVLRELTRMDAEPVMAPPLDPRWVWKGGGSTFAMETDAGWVEKAGTGDDYRFVEKRRDAETVELLDPTRNKPDGGVVIRIGEQKAYVWNRHATDHPPDLVYEGGWVEAAKPAGVSGVHDTRRAWLHDAGRFARGPGGWEEVSPTGLVFRFEEIGRSWDGVDLLDRSRSAPNGILVRLRDGKAQIWFELHEGDPVITYLGGWTPE